MGQLNAAGHMLTVAALAHDGDIAPLWDLMDEMAVRLTGDENATVGVHSLGPDLPRFCVHPTGRPDAEFRSDDLAEALLAGAMHVAAQLGDEMWRRD